MQVFGAYHPCFQPTGIPKPKEFFAEENVGRCRSLWQRPQLALDCRDTLRGRHLPGTQQPSGARGGDGYLREALRCCFQSRKTLPACVP